MRNRGIVLGYQMREHGEGKSTIQFALDPAVIRRNLIYWDHIEWPVFRNPFESDVCPDSARYR